MLVRIIVDAYRFFDRRWRIIIVSSLVSLGLAGILDLLIRKVVPLPSIALQTENSKPFLLDYNDLLAEIIYFLAYIWLEGFIAILAQAEIKSNLIKFSNLTMHTTRIYPRLFLVKTAAQLIMFMSFISALPAISLDYIGIMFLIPAFVFAVWFSLVSPVVAIDNIKGIKKVLIRSRLLVHGYFWTVFAAIIISQIPPVVIVGLETNSLYYWPITTFIRTSSAIIGSLIIVFTYIDLKAVRELASADSVNTNSTT